MDDRAMPANDGLRPWPRIRDTWWVFGLAASALGIFLLAFMVALRCGPRGCHGSLATRLLDLDAVGGLPRLFTTALFLGVGRAGLAGATGGARRRRHLVDGGRAPSRSASRWRRSRACTRRSRTPCRRCSPSSAGWRSPRSHSSRCGRAGRRWGMAAARPGGAGDGGVRAGGAGLDLLTGLAASLQERVGWLTVSGATFVEELGEALAALLLLVTVRWHSPRSHEAGAGGVVQVFWRAR